MLFIHYIFSKWQREALPGYCEHRSQGRPSDDNMVISKIKYQKAKLQVKIQNKKPPSAQGVKQSCRRMAGVNGLCGGFYDIVF
jgi:hypothetical protein